LEKASKTPLCLLVRHNKIIRRLCGGSHQAGIEQVILETMDSKWSYSLKWHKLSNDDGDDDDVDDDNT